MTASSARTIINRAKGLVEHEETGNGGHDEGHGGAEGNGGVVGVGDLRGLGGIVTGGGGSGSVCDAGLVKAK